MNTSHSIQQNKVATVRVHDAVSCSVHGLTPHEYLTLYENYGYKVDGYFYNPKAKLRKWDGKKRFFHKSGKTFKYLMRDILHILKMWGYSIVVKNNLHPLVELPPITSDYLGFGIELEMHQLNAVNAVLTNNGNGIIVAGTGAGKTYICAAISKCFTEVPSCHPVVNIVPSTDLLYQTIDEFGTVGIECGIYGDGKKDINGRDVVVTTWQSLQHSPNLMSMFNGVIVDETHKAQSKVLESLLKDYGGHIRYRVGVTGTLPDTKAENLTVRCLLGDPVFEITAEELMRIGWLARLNLKVVVLKEPMTEEYQKYLETVKDSLGDKKPTVKQFKDAYLPDYASEMKYLKSKAERNQYIADFINNLKSAKGNTFVLVNGVAYGKRLAKLIPGAEFIYGKDKTAVRKEVFGRFADNDGVVVISTFNLASTGLNIKRIFNLVMVDSGKSYVRVIQSIGRALRKAHDKNDVNVVDIASDLKYSKRHLNKRLTFYKKSNYDYTVSNINY